MNSGFSRWRFWAVLVAFRIFVGNVSKYFKEINRGIDLSCEWRCLRYCSAGRAGFNRKKDQFHTAYPDEKKTDAGLRSNGKMTLLCILAHDLKTPLSSVIGYLTLLGDEGQISDELGNGIYLYRWIRQSALRIRLTNFEITRFNLLILRLYTVNQSDKDAGTVGIPSLKTDAGRKEPETGIWNAAGYVYFMRCK